MTSISDLTFDLVEEILSRVPITCLRTVLSACKRWYALSKDQRFMKKHRGALVNTTYDTRDGTIFSLLDIKDLPSIKEIGKIPCPVKVLNVYVCYDGLFLCLGIDYKMLLWNPYLAQTRYIKDFSRLYYTFFLGKDNNNNTKVLRIIYDPFINIKVEEVEIYDLKSESWRILDITPNSLSSDQGGVSLKGNTYFVIRKHWERFEEDCVVCFDFTTERLRSPLPLPFNADAAEDDVYISSIRDEQLALLFQRCQVAYEIEFWITTNIELNAASWTKLFKVNMNPLDGARFQPDFLVRNFFVDKEKKVAVVCGICYEREDSYNTIFYVVGEDGNYKELDPRDVLSAAKEKRGDVFSYIPNPVPIQ